MLVAGGMLEQFQRQWKQWGQVAGPTEWGHTFGCFDSKWSFMLFRSGTCSMSKAIVNKGEMCAAGWSTYHNGVRRCHWAPMRTVMQKCAPLQHCL